MVPADAPHQHGKEIAASRGAGARLTVGQLAHELNSLLDGSLRSMSLALHELEPLAETPEAALEPILGRLQVARAAMWRMAEVLERAMRTRGAARVLDCPRPLGRELPQVVELVRPWAESQGVRIAVEIASEAGTCPLGPLAAVVLNGLRNAVTACLAAGGGGDPAAVTLAVRLGPRDELEIEIADTGPGPDGDPAPGGHGLGLGICRQIVADLGGSLTLAGGGRGAVLRVTVPRANLERP